MSTGIAAVSTQTSTQNVSCLQGVSNWARDNPTTVKTLKVAASFFGIALGAALFVSSTAITSSALLAVGLTIFGYLTMVTSIYQFTQSVAEFIGPSSDSLFSRCQLGISAGGTLSLTFEDVRTRPEYYLELVTRSAGAFPARIRLIDSPRAYDANGITREFVSKLMKYVAESNLVALSEISFPRQINPQTQATYKKLGMFYSIIDQKNSIQTNGNFSTGTLFHYRFFQIVRRIAEGATQSELRNDAGRQMIAAAPANNLPAWSPLILEPNNQTRLQAYADALGISPQEALEATYDLIDEVINAARSFYEGTTPDFKAKILSTDSANLARQIQGVPTSKESLIEALVDQGFGRIANEFRWIREKINSSDEEWRKRFVRVITGSETLSPTTRITINARGDYLRAGTFEIHTCFSSLDVPAGLEKERFLEALDAVLADSGYNTV